MSEDRDIAALFLEAAHASRKRDLLLLLELTALLNSSNALIHALQRERGAMAIVLGSAGDNFKARLEALTLASKVLEAALRERLSTVAGASPELRFSNRFYARAAFAINVLDSLEPLRARVRSLDCPASEAVQTFSRAISSLIAAGSEIADIPADPMISRALLALVMFTQGKEYAGQERAVGGAAFPTQQLDQEMNARLKQLIGLQDHAFRVFANFAPPEDLRRFEEVQDGPLTSEVRRLRRLALAKASKSQLPKGFVDEWYLHTTARIDQLRQIEERMTTELARLCEEELSVMQVAYQVSGSGNPQEIANPTHVAMISHGVFSGGAKLYTTDPLLQQPFKSMLDVMQAQSRQLSELSDQLSSTRAALNERKVIERAKGLLMASHKLDEEQAYELMRQSAMKQNRRLYEVASDLLNSYESSGSDTR